MSDDTEARKLVYALAGARRGEWSWADLERIAGGALAEAEARGAEKERERIRGDLLVATGKHAKRGDLLAAHAVETEAEKLKTPGAQG